MRVVREAVKLENNISQEKYLKIYKSLKSYTFIQRLHNETKHDLCKTQIPFHTPAGPELPVLVCSQKDL